MESMVSVVTGANSGIGLETARALANRGDRVFLVCRSEERATAAKRSISVSGGCEPVVVLADLSNQKEIVRAAEFIRGHTDRLDVLVNNAGGYFPTRLESADGIEMNLALNHLGYFRLTHELMSLLNVAVEPRIVNVASRAHRTAKLDLNDLQFAKRRYRPFVAYGTSKLMNIMFTRRFAELYPNGPTANAVHPGVVRTGFGHDFPSLFSWLAALASPIMVSPTKGAETSIRLAVDRELRGITGGYFADSKPAKPRRKALDEAKSKALWLESERLCGIRFGSNS